LYKPFLPEKIWIEKRVLRNETTREILSRLPEVPIMEIDTISEVVAREIRASDEKFWFWRNRKASFLNLVPARAIMFAVITSF
jgi:hypothetical protein